MNVYRILSISLLSFSFNCLSQGRYERAHGPNRLSYNNSITKIQKRENEQKIYYFDITEEKREYWMPKKKPEVDVFSWDTLSKESVMEPWIFRIRNKTDHSIFVTDVSCTIKDIFLERTSENIKIDSNEYVEIIARVNPLKAGHFYCTIELQCLHPKGMKKMEIHQWGFRDKEYIGSLSSIDSVYFKNEIRKVQYKRNKPIRIYLSDGDFNIHDKLSITGYEKDHMVYPKRYKNGDETYFEIDTPRNIWDSLILHVEHDEHGVIAKSTIDSRRLNENTIVIFAFPKKWDTPYYYTQSHPYIYEPKPYVYQLTYDYTKAKGLKPKDINAYIAARGIKVQADSRGFIFISNLKDALPIDKKLSSLKYGIKLLPVFHYSTLDQNGWGGDCSWLTDIVEVRFFSNVPHEKRMKALENYDFIRSRNDYTGNQRIYMIRLKSVIDRKYMSQLKTLYQKKEVKSIQQQHGGIVGLD